MKVMLCMMPCSSSSVTGVSGSALSSGAGGVGHALCEGVVCVCVCVLVGESNLSVTSPRALARVLDRERAVSGIGGMMDGRRQSVLIGYG